MGVLGPQIALCRYCKVDAARWRDGKRYMFQFGPTHWAHAVCLIQRFDVVPAILRVLEQAPFRSSQPEILRDLADRLEESNWGLGNPTKRTFDLGTIRQWKPPVK